MPASFVIDHQHRIVRSKGWGVLVEADFMGTQRGLREDKQFDPTYRQIYDFSEVTSINISSSQLQSIAYASPFSPQARRAFVVSSDVAFGMARMYSLMGDRNPETLRIFRDRGSALSWLGLSDDLNDDSPPARVRPPKDEAPRARE